MKSHLLPLPGQPLPFALLIILITLGSFLAVHAAPPAGEPTVVTISTNGASPVVAPAAPKLPGDDDDDSADGNKHKSLHLEINSDHDDDSGTLQTTLIPIIGILATFGAPVLIVFFIFYFKYRRRQDNLALAREFLSKGLPVPPQLLDESQGYSNPSSIAPNMDPSFRGCSDIRKGWKWTFVGVAITLALYVDDPHSTSWGWGLIPLIIGNGLVIAGWVELRLRRADPFRQNPPAPPDVRR